MGDNSRRKIIENQYGNLINLLFKKSNGELRSISFDS
jgi:hypothetical protein